MNNLFELFDSFRIIILDFDETIARINTNWIEHVHKLKSYFPELSDLYKDRFDKYPNSYIVVRNTIVEHYGQKILPRLRKITEELETELSTSVEYNNEMINFIKANCGKKNMYIWSGNCTKIIDQELKKIGIRECFKKLITQDTLKFLKPYPDGFEQIYEEGTKKSDYIMFGDSQNDYLACKSVGIQFVHVDMKHQNPNNKGNAQLIN